MAGTAESLPVLRIVCSLQITQELREYAQQHQIDEEEAAQVSVPLP